MGSNYWKGSMEDIDDSEVKSRGREERTARIEAMKGYGLQVSGYCLALAGMMIAAYASAYAGAHGHAAAEARMNRNRT